MPESVNFKGYFPNSVTHVSAMPSAVGFPKMELLGKRLARLRLERGFKTGYALARAAGLTPTQIKAIEDGVTKNPRGETLEKIARALRLSIDELMSDASPRPRPIDHDEPRPEHTVTVPIEAVIVGGDPTEAAEMVKETYELLHHHHRAGRHVIRLFGESMWPTYHNGDLLLVDPKEKVPDGKCAVVRIGNETTVKRVFRRKGGRGLLLKGDNPTYPPIEADGDDVQILARVLKIVEGDRP